MIGLGSSFGGSATTLSGRGLHAGSHRSSPMSSDVPTDKRSILCQAGLIVTLGLLCELCILCLLVG